MRFKLYDPYFGTYYVVAEVVIWKDGILTLTTSSSDFRFLCSRMFWRKIQFYFWYGFCYLDLTKLSPAPPSLIPDQED